MSTIQQKTLPAWIETQISAQPAWMEMLQNRPAARLFYRVSKADFPMFPFHCNVEVNLVPHGFQQLSLANGSRLWARIINALEDQERIDDLLQMEQDFIARYGDCLTEQGGV